MHPIHLAITERTMTDQEQIAILEAEAEMLDNYLQKVWLPRMLYLGKTIHELKTKNTDEKGV